MCARNRTTVTSDDLYRTDLYTSLTVEITINVLYFTLGTLSVSVSWVQDPYRPT
ncbi:hypothetical protein MGG_15684 [Pyricularia oryzae 70-15]|uniref:Uncharacterized protein n=4 Tax=Pyricularia oryzae TaxID=318829 RepID=G4MZ39_PYRO7|nr:uncharacterized protein MGG_15684 [Pyricularia oryzae 70-15]ELQ41968.1 hypothetical protein OOU_Y34scaffold00245g19 [Pyricularia oryzae Y34]KAI7931778.1 hypothetical protein M9X92_000096 [Pyricularia oryzae]EHA54506.1 hypothetical protein MGG_15684 [Pyricularia oryzae 70-15]KAI7932730.1 hypothetical protein M0657_000039 [Pyricularia oryzae]QBZ56160.1 hypothetical protein PoMZ_01066 [Pyricularia oryzae]